MVKLQTALLRAKQALKVRICAKFTCTFVHLWIFSPVNVFTCEMVCLFCRELSANLLSSKSIWFVEICSGEQLDCDKEKTLSNRNSWTTSKKVANCRFHVFAIFCTPVIYFNLVMIVPIECPLNECPLKDCKSCRKQAGEAFQVWYWVTGILSSKYTTQPKSTVATTAHAVLWSDHTGYATSCMVVQFFSSQNLNIF